MNEQKRLAAHCGKIRKQFHLFATTGGERRLVVKEKWNVGAKRGSQFVQFCRRQRRAKKFIERGEGHGGVRAAAANATGQWQIFLEMNADAIGNFCGGEKCGRGTGDELF